MTGLQRLITTLLRPWAADIEADSRAWACHCPACGEATSIWDLGGVRWKAKGNPKRLLRCRACGETGWHTVAKRPMGGSADSPPVGRS